MNSVLKNVLAAIALVTAGASAEQFPSFDEYATKYSKTYADEDSRTAHEAVYKENIAFIVSYNAEHTTHKLGLTEYTDLTAAEFKASKMGFDSSMLDESSESALGPKMENFQYKNVSPPDEVDWNKKGAVTPVKNQAQCGSCWTFSATGAMEGINQINNGKLISLSEQEIVDCDKSGNGCGGGLPELAFDWAIKNGGMALEKDYGYTAKNGKCDTSKTSEHAVEIDGFVDVPRKNEDALKQAVSQQPVSIAIEADHPAFQHYTSGVFDADCGTTLDHAVLAVGYGTDAGKDYWLVKNSWGATWGEEGYIRLSRGEKGAAGQCGIANHPSYPHQAGSKIPALPKCSWYCSFLSKTIIGLKRCQNCEFN